MKLFLCILFSFLFCTLFAQKRPFKFGKVTKEELEMKECAFHPEAGSMVLGKWANLSFEYDDQLGFVYRVTITTRKKIFSLSDKEEGDFRIKYYHPINSGSEEEDVSSVKASTYNLIDGEIQKEKLSNKEEFVNRLNDYWAERTFAMPNVQEGSVIEYKYEIRSPYISNLYTWYFQEEIPVAYSEFTYTIPEYFNYQHSQAGNLLQLQKIEENKIERFTYKWETETGIGGNKSSGTSTLESNSKYTKLIAKEVRPVEEEPYMNNKGDLPSRIEFQLMSTDYPNQPIKVVAGNYGKLNKTLLESTSFGKRLNKGSFANDFLSTISELSLVDKASQIQQWIKNNISWNEYNSYSSAKAGKQVFNDKSGNIADINLTYVAVLREAGLEAYPIVLSTRGNGSLHSVYPNYSAFNYVLAGVIVEGKLFLADATTNLPFGMIPTKCLNGKGWMVSEKGGKWIDLKAQANSTFTGMATVSLEEDEIKVNITKKSTGYKALYKNNEYLNEGEEKFISNISSKVSEWELNNFKFDNSKSQSVSTGYTLTKEIDGDLIYLTPLFEEAILENPFKRDRRYSTIDYPYKSRSRFITTIMLPEGYTCELPDPINIALPENGGKYIYAVRQNGNQISLMISYELKKTNFKPDEYEFVKQFFQLVSENNNKVIVLQKS